MRIYVWNNFKRDWAAGLAVVIASSKEEATALLIKEIGDDNDFGGEPGEYPIDGPRAFYCYGGS